MQGEHASTDGEGEQGSRTRVGHTKADPTDVYVGRGPGGRGLLETAVGDRGWLGNPFPVDEVTATDIEESSVDPESFESEEEVLRRVSIEKFRDVFETELESDEAFREAVREVSGSVLGCWCQPLGEEAPACHAEVIAEWADRLASEYEMQ